MTIHNTVSLLWIVTVSLNQTLALSYCLNMARKRGFSQFTSPYQFEGTIFLEDWLNYLKQQNLNLQVKTTYLLGRNQCLINQGSARIKEYLISQESLFRLNFDFTHSVKSHGLLCSESQYILGQ